MAQANIIDVVEDNFQMEVLHYSNRMPVVIDFWAPGACLVRCSHKNWQVWRLKRMALFVWRE